MEAPSLQTERLLLRPFQLTDAADVKRLVGEKEIADTTLLIPHPYEDGMAEEWITRQAEKFTRGESVNFAIVLRQSGELIGSIGLVLNNDHARGELGYWIGKPYWGTGYGTEAARAVLDHGFGELRLHRIYAGHFARNPASGRVMEKLGMRYEGFHRQHLKKGDGFEDEHVYGILRSDWQNER